MSQLRTTGHPSLFDDMTLLFHYNLHRIFDIHINKSKRQSLLTASSVNFGGLHMHVGIFPHNINITFITSNLPGAVGILFSTCKG